MLRYIIRRVLGVPFLLLGVASVAFILSQSTKGDPLSALVPERMMNNPEIVRAVEAQWGLDKPLPVRYVVYMKNLVQGDMGTSFNTRRLGWQLACCRHGSVTLSSTMLPAGLPCWDPRCRSSGRV